MGEYSLKRHFNRETATQLGASIQAVYPVFDVAQYAEQVAAVVDDLELKARVYEMTRLLREQLPNDYENAVDILVQSLGEEHTEAEGMFTDGWYLMPIAHFVEVYGTDHFEASMTALNQITRRHTGEFAIRPLIAKYPDKALITLEKWAHSDSFHVRRLVSEGTRTRLPWTSRLQIFIDNPDPVLDLLTILRDDPVKYVQKSVANNLNDLVKDHRERIVDLLDDWYSDNATDQRRWIIGHAARNLLKDGDVRILKLLGYTGANDIQLADAKLSTERIMLGGNLNVNYTVQNTGTQVHQVLLDYVLGYRLKSGELGSKVFQVKKTTLKPDETLAINKKVQVASNSTRTHYAGAHHIILRINGEERATLNFTVTD